MRKKLIGFVIALLCWGLTACGESSEKNIDSIDKESYEVYLEVQCEENLLFSRYDLEIYVDGEYQVDIMHGEISHFTMNLLEGKHEIVVQKKSESSINGVIEINVMEDNSFVYSAKCKNNKVELEITDSQIVKEEETEKENNSNSEEVKNEDTSNNSQTSDTGNKKSPVIVKITMPNDTDYYEKEEWTVESLVKEFEGLGFTNIVTERMGVSSDYRYGPIHTVRLDGSWIGWDEGDVYDSDDEVEIRYYDPTPTLTIDNCPELAQILSGETSSWMSFAEAHDGEFIEFDGCVVSRIDDEYGVLTDPIIDVCGGDYSDNEGKQRIRLTYISVDYEIKNHVIYGSVGNNYRLIGQIDYDDSKYYKELTIEVVLVEER